VTGYHEQQGALTARILAHVDLAGMPIADRVDLMTAISELAGLEPPGVAPGITMPATAVRHPACVPDRIGVCAAACLDEGLSHCCNNPDPRHDGDHQCRCRHAWAEVRAQQETGACGLHHQTEGTDHECVCRLAVHNLVGGPDLIERPLHACVECDASWTEL
jgi:hypothetical protein